MQMKFLKIRYWIVLILNVTVFSTISFAQKEGNTWYFGENAGLDFNGGSPVALIDGALVTREGCAAISDEIGNLLFYTDGTTVWNRNHVQMPNGFGLMGNSSSTQSALIVRKPGSNNIYYIFTTPAQVNLNGSNGFRYSTVDMSLQNGLGDVVSKNTLLYQPVTEKLTAVRHANGCDIWVIAHEWNTNGFRAYPVSNSGVNTSPVVSTTGAVHSGGTIGTFPNTNTVGQMKVSPDGSKLALAIHAMGIFELFDFDNATGIVSNPLSFPPISNRTYGVEFSPDGTKLYGSLGPEKELYQYDLMAGSFADIINSQTLVGSTTADLLGALQLASDGKIYCAIVGRSYIAAIANPNALGIACNYVENAVSLNGKMCLLGLPTFMQSHMSLQFTYKNHCVGDSTFFSVTDTTNLNAVVWNFNDPSSGSLNTSDKLNPYHIFISPGTYHVQLIKYTGCDTFIFFRPVVIHSEPPINLGNDTLLCQGNTLTLSAETQGASYQWQDGFEGPANPVSSHGLYWVKVTSAAGCLGSDSINIQISNLKADFAYEEIPCTNQIQFINLSTDTLASYWNFGDGITSKENNPLHAYLTNEKYTVILILNSGSQCPDTAQAVIPVENDGISDTLFIPNIFTPNDDGNNDFFEIAGMDNPCINVNKLSIFNRWGLKVFETEGSQLKWDGRSNGNPLTEGTYFYVLEGKEFRRSGGVTLLR